MRSFAGTEKFECRKRLIPSRGDASDNMDTSSSATLPNVYGGQVLRILHEPSSVQKIRAHAANKNHSILRSVIRQAIYRVPVPSP
jgi:hypothetical protein